MGNDNHAKIKSRGWASDDDAENLLAGILDDTEDEAKAEQERIEAEIKAKEEAERLKREEEERRKKEQAAARLNAEMERLQSVEQKRAAKLEAMKIEELKKRGEWVDPEEERRKLEEQLRQEAEVAALKAKAEAEARAKHRVEEAQARGEPIPGMIAPEPKSKTGMIAGIAIVGALVIGGGAVGASMALSYKVDPASYSKTVFAPKEVEVALVEKGFTPIPKPTPTAVVEEDDGGGKTNRRRRARRGGSSSSKSKSDPISSKPKENKASQKAKDLEKALNLGGDIFGSSP